MGRAGSPSSHSWGTGMTTVAGGRDGLHVEGFRTGSARVARAFAGTATAPAWLGAVVLAAVLAAVWGVSLLSGGSQTPVPHLFYVPIVLAAVPFGVRGTLVVAVVATILAGPLLPLDTASGEAQQPSFWLIRGAMYVAVGGVASFAMAVHEKGYTQRLAGELRNALVRRPGGATEVDQGIVPLVREVLETRAFTSVFQPIYSLADGKLSGVEALTRFHAEPYRTPDVWFAAAHAVGLGTELELAALEAALEAATDLPSDVGISLNASPTTLGDPRFLELVRRTGDRRVTVEVTEHHVVEDYPVLSSQIDALRAAGARLAVDDAGAGVASLQHIVQLAPDVIKLDMSLTQQLEGSPVRRALAGALIDFAEHSGAQLVVEGIEDVDDLRIWSSLGAHAAQGYLIGRPGPLPHPDTSTTITTLRPTTEARATS